MWFARFFKTRGLATKLVQAGHVRVNSTKISKPSHSVGPDDTLTFLQAKTVRVVRIVEVGARRGPASEAQALYDDLTPVPEISNNKPFAERKGRPTKRDRRAIIKSRREMLD
ncbi:MAG: RNA-binding protein S4 [Marinosulfonomonas sp.]|nr:MAG: RNA-binding protein S4 [Marinosulfonomonas sp.]